MRAGGRVVAPQALAGEPRVSVVIPCYNYARFVRDAIESATGQPGVDLEVIVVDDASTDGSADVAASLAAEDPRVRVLRHRVNAGHVETSNEALAAATGDFVVKLDADDLLTPGSLRRSAALLSAFPEMAVVYGRPVEFRGDPPVVPDQPASSWTVWKGARWQERLLRRGRNIIMQPEVMLRRTAVEATGGYRPALRWAEDYNWWLRLSSVGDVGRVNGVPQGLYRVHDKSFQRSADDLELADLRARIDATELFFAERGASLSDKGLPRTATRALLRDARRLAARARDRAAGGAEAAREFDAVAARVRAHLPGVQLPGPSSAVGPWGRRYRDLESRITWRIWAEWGV